MKKTLILILAVFLVVPSSQIVRAQSMDNPVENEVGRFELGGQLTLLRRSDADTGFELFRRNGFILPSVSPAKISEFGIGARFAFNFSRNIAVEAEANFFPDDKRASLTIGVPVRILEPGGRKFQAFFGPKIGYRGRKIGVFGKVRPGFLRIDRFDVAIAVGPPDQFFVLTEQRKDVVFFNVDVGGVFEYYPSPRTIFRVDVGDTIIRYGAQRPKELNPSFTRHNLQTSVGFGFRF